MAYILVAVFLITSVIVYLRYSFTVRAKNTVEKIRLAWSQPKNEWFHFDRIGRYAALTKDKEFHQLSEQTMYDIDFYNLFRFIDRTTSKIGQQILFKKILQPINSREALQSLDRNADFFIRNSQLREETQKELQKLGSNDTYYITSLLQEKLLERPKWLRFLFVNILLIVGLLVMSIQYPVLLIFLIIPQPSPTVNQRGRGLGFGTRYYLVDGGNGTNAAFTYVHTTAGIDNHFMAGSYEENELMRAEAEIQLGNIGVGVGLIDNVRNYQNANLAPINPGSTKAQALEELRSERRVSLLFRGLGFYDLRRNGVTDDKSKGGGRGGAVVLSNIEGTPFLNTNAFINYNYLSYWDVPANELVFNNPSAGSASVVSPE